MNPCRGALRKVRGDCVNGCERSEMPAAQRSLLEEDHEQIVDEAIGNISAES